MTTQKKVLKGMIIFILAVFLLSTILMSVMYFTGNAPQDQNLTGDSNTDVNFDTGDAADEANQ